MTFSRKKHSQLKIQKMFVRLKLITSLDRFIAKWIYFIKWLSALLIKFDNSEIYGCVIKLNETTLWITTARDKKCFFFQKLEIDEGHLDRKKRWFSGTTFCTYVKINDYDDFLLFFSQGVVETGSLQEDRSSSTKKLWVW